MSLLWGGVRILSLRGNLLFGSINDFYQNKSSLTIVMNWNVSIASFVFGTGKHMYSLHREGWGIIIILVLVLSVLQVSPSHFAAFSSFRIRGRSQTGFRHT